MPARPSTGPGQLPRSASEGHRAATLSSRSTFASSSLHRRVNLLAVGHHRVARQWIVMLPARQLADATDLAVNGAQTRAVALTPDHALVIGRRDLAAALDQRSVGVKE